MLKDARFLCGIFLNMRKEMYHTVEEAQDELANNTSALTY